MRVTVALPTLKTDIGPARFRRPAAADLALEEAGELLVEARQAAAAVEQVLLAAGPGRVRFRVDIEMQRIAWLAPGGPGGEFGAVGHDHFDGVVVGMGVGLHGVGTGLSVLRNLAALYRGRPGETSGRCVLERTLPGRSASGIVRPKRRAGGQKGIAAHEFHC